VLGSIVRGSSVMPGKCCDAGGCSASAGCATPRACCAGGHAAARLQAAGKCSSGCGAACLYRLARLDSADNARRRSIGGRVRAGRAAAA